MGEAGGFAPRASIRWLWGAAATWLLAAAPASALVSTVRVATGLTQPVFATAPPDDFSRLFILERTGRIKILDLVTGQISPTPFLTLNNVSSGFAEQGLLGLAFHPEYATNGQFFVDYVDQTGATRIERYQVSQNGGVADPTPTLLLSIPHPQPNHNGGWLGFGPDGYLYVSAGDGGSADDLGSGHTEGIGNAQDLTDNKLGKILRLDVDHPSGGLNYGIPESNPFVGIEGDDEIWAYGLRNPWRPSFDRETGDLWIADVGQNAKEELNFQPADSPGGENYGWRLREGTIPTPTPLPPATPVGGPKPPGAIDPIHEYDHTAQLPNRSITGGYVYRGPIEELQGKYFFADFSNAHKIWSLRFDGSDPSEFDGSNFIEFEDWTQRLAPNVGSIQFIGSFGEDAAGNLYLIDLGVGAPGEIYRVVPEPASAALLGAALAALAGARRRGPARPARRSRLIRSDGPAKLAPPPAEGSMQRMLLLALALLLPAHADALVYISGNGQGNTSAPPDDPGWDRVANVGGLSGIYLGNGWVLTANHVGTANPLIQGVWYPVVPGSDVQLENPNQTPAELKVFRIDPSPSLPLVRIRETTPPDETDVTLMGRGALRGAATSWMGHAGFFWAAGGGLHWATNRVYESGFEGGSWTISTEFNKVLMGGTTHEGQGATGDSGGAAFIKNGSNWELAGVLFAIVPYPSQPDSTSLYGNLTYATDLSVYRDQIIDLTRPECANEVDDDGDTFVDWPDDPDCDSELGLTELPDQDVDGVGDPEDNCLTVANADQRDTNLDGYGNLCDGDFDDDEAVTNVDFVAFKQSYLKGEGDPGYDEDMDLDGGAGVTTTDFVLFRSMYLGPPGPSGLGCAGSPPCP